MGQPNTKKPIRKKEKKEEKKKETLLPKEETKKMSELHDPGEYYVKED